MSHAIVKRHRLRLLSILLGGLLLLVGLISFAEAPDRARIEAALNGRQQGAVVGAGPLRVDDAVRVALSQNRELRASIYELGIARAALVQAGLFPNPEVELELRVPTDPSEPLQGDVGLEYNLSTLFLRSLRRSVARADLTAERLRVTSEALDLAYRARLGFYQVQARQQLLALRQRALAALQAAYTTATELHRAGNLTDLDLALHRSALEGGHIAEAETEVALLDAREQLNLVLGLSAPQTAWSITDRLPDPPANQEAAADLEHRAIEASLELAELRTRLDATSRRLSLARTEGRLPHLATGFHGERDGRQWELGAHLTVGLPLFDRAQGRVQAATAESQGLRERSAAVAVAVRVSLRQTRNRLESSARRARHYRDILVPARERVLKETLLQYNAMQVSVFQVLEAQRNVTESASAYVETLWEYWRARAALDQILAGRHRVTVVGGESAGTRAMGTGTAPGH